MVDDCWCRHFLKTGPPLLEVKNKVLPNFKKWCQKLRMIKTKWAEKTRSQNMHSSQSYGQNTVAKFQIHRGDPVKWKILNTILSISLVWRHILTYSLFCWFCFDNTQLLAPIFWNLEEIYFSLSEGEVRFLKTVLAGDFGDFWKKKIFLDYSTNKLRTKT